jgi:hypothetical protein
MIRIFRRRHRNKDSLVTTFLTGHGHAFLTIRIFRRHRWFQTGTSRAALRLLLLLPERSRMGARHHRGWQCLFHGTYASKRKLFRCPNSLPASAHGQLHLLVGRRLHGSRNSVLRTNPANNKGHSLARPVRYQVNSLQELSLVDSANARRRPTAQSRGYKQRNDKLR